MDRKPWHGVLVATALPWRDNDEPDLDAYATHIRWLAEHGCHGVTPNGSLGEYQLLTDAQRDAVVRTAVEAAPDGLQRDARASPRTASRAGPPAHRGRRRGRLPGRDAAAAERLPGQRGRGRRALPRRRRGRAADRRLQQPDRHQGRPDAGAAGPAVPRGPDRRRSRSSPATCAATTRSPSSRPTSTCWPAATTSRSSWRSPARPAGSRATRTRSRPPASTCSPPPSCTTSKRALPLYRTLHPLLRWDSKTEFVQAIKLSMDIVPDAINGGRCLPPRGPLSEYRGRRRPRGDREGARGRAGLARMRSIRTLHAVDSHTEGMPTRVIVGGVGRDPGRHDGRAAASTSWTTWTTCARC